MKKFLTILILISAFSVSCTAFRGPGDLNAPILDGLSSPTEYDVENASEVQNSHYQEFVDEAAKFAWPVTDGKITQGFNIVARRPHLGIDISAKRGTTIRAAHDGIVIYAGAGFRGYGKMIIIEYGDKWASLYSHLSKIRVREKQKIKRGQALGAMGRTGNATGVHLHFELRYQKDAVDPLRFLPQTPPYITYNH